MLTLTDSSFAAFKPRKLFSKSVGLGSLLAAVVLASSYVEAATVTLTGNRNISSAQWQRIVDRAGNGGRIEFGAGQFTATGQLTIDRPVTVVGAGRGNSGTSVRIGGNQRQLFAVTSSNVRIVNMRIGGIREPEFDNLIGPDGRIEEGVRASRGTETAIQIIGDDVVNLRVVRCWLRNVNVGIEMRNGARPDGLLVRDVDFTVTRGMVLANDASVPGGALTRPFLIERCRMVNRNRQLDASNRPLTIRGIVFDFGNNNRGTDVDPIDLNGSMIRDCSFLRVSFWQIGMTQTSNVTITGNVLPGGGVDNQEFVHCLHFEDVGDVSNPIVITDNIMRQVDRQRFVSHIWAGGNSASGGTALRIARNTFSGIDDDLVLVKSRVDEATGNRQFAHTVGSDVPARQQRRQR